jgi:pilus assembly protein FimV
MVYEQWEQAEQFVRDAIAKEPSNLDFHAKLLEVFYSSGNRKKYEAAAKALHDIVGGSGPYWDNAVVMWQEMSPNRALFAAGGEEEEGPAATATGGGLLDLTAATSREEGGLDFDLGDATAEPAAKPAAEEPVLDITAGTEDAAPEETQAESADMLDVTAAVGLETEEPSLDLEPSREEGVLDLTGGSEPQKGDLLDVSGSGGDLLDVTAQTDVGSQEIADEDLLDVTSTAASARSESEEPAEEAPAEAKESIGEHTLDFNLEDLPQPGASDTESEPEPQAGGNIIEFESSGGGLELASNEETRLSATDETSLGGGLELDMGDTPAVEEAPSEPALELDLTIDETPAAPEAPADEIDMDGTVEIPKLELADEEEDDEEEDHTVFVPRSGDAQEQSAEDEIATKLDLAKAYVELGDKESAKGILDQVLAEGTDQQKRKAQELMRQMS